MNIDIKKLNLKIQFSIGNKYDDFHSKANFNILIFKENDKSLSLNAKLIYKKFIESDSHNSHVEFDLNGINLDEIYISFLKLSNYREILSFLGKGAFELFLMEISDINFLNFKSEEIPKEEILFKTLLRDAESYEIFNNFDEVYLSTNYSIPEKIVVSENVFNYFAIGNKSDCINANIFGFIGVNGVGKSYTLNNLARKISLSTEFYRVIGLSTTKESDKTFNSIKFQDNYKFKFADSDFINEKSVASIIYDIARLKDSKLKSFLEISKLVLSYERLAFEDDNGLYHSLSDIYLGGELSVLLRRWVVNNWALKIVKADGEPRDPSSGEITCLKIISSIFSLVRNDSVFLFDEIENHLHPNYITRIIYSISKVLREYNCVAIFSTHSPYVVREMIDSNVLILKKSCINNELEFVKPNIKTLGADLQELSNFIFEDEFVSLVLTSYLNDSKKNVDELDFVPESAKIIINSGL